MKKISAVMLSLTMFAGLFTGCASNGDQVSAGKTDLSKSGSDNSGKKVTLTFWRHDFAPEAKSLKEMITSFEQKYPNITIDFKMIPNDQYETKVRTALAGGSAPDIMALDAPTLASYASQNAIIPLDKYLDKDGNKDDIAKPVLEGMTYNGKVYAAPNNDASLAMFYNKKMFEAKGIPLPSKDPAQAWTWDQALDAAKKLNDPANGVYGLNPTPWGFAGHEGVPFSEMTFLWQAGANILSPDMTTAKGFLDSDQAKKALGFWKTLYNTDKVSPKELPQDAFPNGKVAINVDGPWAMSYLQEHFPNFKLGVDYDVAPLWKDAQQVTPNGSWNMAITSQSKHPDEAWLFVNYVTGVEGSKKWYKDTQNLPARLSTADAFPELKQYPMNIFVQQSAKNARPRPVTPAYPVISDAIRILFEQVGLGNGDVNQALNTAVQKIDDGLAKVKK